MRLETASSSIDPNLKDFANWIIKIADETFGSDNSSRHRNSK